MTSRKTTRVRRFVFISSNAAWGGSEELWSGAAAALAASGHRITVLKAGIDPAEPRIRRLIELGCRLYDLVRIPFLPRPALKFLLRATYPGMVAQQILRLRIAFAFLMKSDLVVLSQGGNHDGIFLASAIPRERIPYALIVQKATDLYWPADEVRQRMRRLYTGARATFFVSEHNRSLTEEQIGTAIPNATVARNPFLVPWEMRKDWPEEQSGLSLACIGRMHAKEKGQDILLRVLAREKWRSRRVSVTFYGTGLNQSGLEQMAHFHRLENVWFRGFVREISAIWDNHHALVLPSRCEGLPLVVVEAMLSGRVPIVTDTGGNREVVDDGVTGFIATSASEDALDDAMERAWQRRHEWRAIGTEAAGRIRQLVPPDPCAAMAAMLLAVADGSFTAGMPATCAAVPAA